MRSSLPRERAAPRLLSHTKRGGAEGTARLHALIERTRYLISNTRLGEFFDANTIQAGTDWADELVWEAGQGALLAFELIFTRPAVGANTR